MLIPEFKDVQSASHRIRSQVHLTPVLTSRRLDELAASNVFFKCENLQRSGSFKFRGACNAVLRLSEIEAQRGVVTHSSGNHAAALALAAQQRGIPATIVIPLDAPAVKIQAVRAYGGAVELCEPTLAARQAGVVAIQAATGAILVHPYDDAAVIAGQGTATLEFMQQIADLDAILVPVSGGGLISGTAIAAKGINPNIRVFGAEPQNADDAFRSFQSASLQPLVRSDTIADGLRATLCPRTFSIIQRFVSGILTVSEPQILDAMRQVWQTLKIVVEPSGAVAYAALLAHRQMFVGQRVGILISGGNLDLDRLPWQA